MACRRIPTRSAKTIKAVSAVRELGKGKPGFSTSRTQVPPLPGSAVIIHCTEGLTLDWGVIDLMDCQANGQLHVALSRARSLDYLLMKSMTRGVRVSREVQALYAGLQKLAKSGQESEYSDYSDDGASQDEDGSEWGASTLHDPHMAGPLDEETSTGAGAGTMTQVVYLSAQHLRRRIGKLTAWSNRAGEARVPTMG